MSFLDKIKEAKARYIIGALIGAALFLPQILLMFIAIPKGNETLFASLISTFSTGFGAFVNHIMKTPENEKPIK